MVRGCILLFTVRIYDASIARSSANPKRIYCIDHAFVQSTSSGILTNSRHMLENLVFIALRRLEVIPAWRFLLSRGDRKLTRPGLNAKHGGNYSKAARITASVCC
jgi:hypothetical protein